VRDNLPIEILEQWEHKVVFLVLQKTPFGEQYGVIEKENPGASIGVKTMDDLKQLILTIESVHSLSDLFWESQRRRRIVGERMDLPPIERPKLEDYRRNEIGKSFLKLTTGADRIHSTYEGHSRAAFDYTLGDIGLFEKSFDFIHTGHNIHSAIGLWHMTLESYITTLLKLCCLKKNEDFEKKYRNQDLHVRFGSLLDLLEIDKIQFYQTKIIAKILEFSRFRNELMHDRHFGKEIQFDHCQFSGIPTFACQVDAVQSLLVVLETTSLLRYVIAGLDTMPTVIIRDGKRVAWEKFDIAYNEILRPFFEYTLDKHAMTTSLNLDFNSGMKITSPIFYKGEVESLITVNQDLKYEIILNDSKTDHLPQLIQSYFQSRNQPEETIRVAKTMLRDK